MTGLPQLNYLSAAIVTPLTPDFRPNLPRLLDHVRWLLTRGCDGVTLFGTTGEGPEFSVEDRITTLDGMIAGGIDPPQIIVSITALCIPDIVRLARHATSRRVAGVLLMPPCVYRDGITEDGTFRFYDTIIASIDSPDLRLYLYHFPDISGVPITPQVIRRLDERYPGSIAGVKDSGGDIDVTEDLVRRFSHLSILTGTEIHLPHLLSVGLCGTVCGLANVMPRLMRTMMDRPTEFDRRQLLQGLRSADVILSRRPFIPSVKTVLADITGETSWRRVVPPLAELPILERQRVAADFRRWDANLAEDCRSLEQPHELPSNVIDLKRA